MPRRTRLGGSKTRSTSRLGNTTRSGVSSGASGGGVRATRKNQVNWSRVAAAILVLGSLALIYQLFAGQRFATRHITVQGNYLLSQADIEQTTGLLGRSIFHVNHAQVASALLDQYGCLAEVDVQTRLPNEVIVRTREVKDLVIWQSGGSMWWVTRQGTCLGPAHTAQDLPVIHDLYGHNTEPHDYIVGVPWEMLQDLLVAQPDTPGYDFTREHGMITFIGEERWPVFLGRQGEARFKLAIMSALYDELTSQRRSAEYVDLRSEREPTYKPR